MNQMTISRLLILGLAAVSLYGCGSDDAGSGGGGGTSADVLIVRVTGNGLVSSNPAGIKIGNDGTPGGNGTDGSESVSAAGVATYSLTPSAASGHQFVRWEGACTGSGACNLLLGAAPFNIQTVTALFAPVSGAVSEIIALTGSTTVDPNGRLLSFSRTSPNNVTSTRISCAIGTIAPASDVCFATTNENFVGVDFHPGTGDVYLLARNSMTGAGSLYTLDVSGTLGLATFRANLIADPTDTSSAFTMLDGTSFGLDFNPVKPAALSGATERFLRVVSNTGQNLRINPGASATDEARGRVITDAALSGTGATGVSAAAYTNNFRDNTGVANTGTLLYVLNHTDRTLHRQDIAAAPGVLTLVGSLNLAGVGASNGFDVAGTQGSGDSPSTNREAYAVFDVGGARRLVKINLATGAAVGAVSGSSTPNTTDNIDNGTPTIVGMTFVSSAGVPTRGDTYAVRTKGSDPELVTFNRTAPNTILTSTLLSREAGAGFSTVPEQLVAMDFKPTGGALIGLLVNSNTKVGRFATVDRITGLVGTAAFTAGTGTRTFAGTASNFDMQFDPTTEFIRVVSDAVTGSEQGSESFLINPADGVESDVERLHRNAGTDDTAAQITAVAYTNGFGGTRSTSLFLIDTATGALARFDEGTGTSCSSGNIGAPGCIINIGAGFGANFSGLSGFKIDALDNTAYAALTQGSAGASVTRLYSINLTTGAAVGAVSSAAIPVDADKIGDGLSPVVALAFRPPSRAEVFGLTSNNHLVKFDPNPAVSATVTDVGTITGLGTDVLIGMDFLVKDCAPPLLPAAAVCPLHAVAMNGAAGNVYRINTTTAAATLPRTINRNVDDTATGGDFSGFSAAAAFGSDFDPALDTDAVGFHFGSTVGQHTQVKVDNGSTTLEPNFTRPVPPPALPGTARPVADVIAMAFSGNTNNPAIARSLFVVDREESSLYLADPATGNLTLRGPLFPPLIPMTTLPGPVLDASADGGFDIAGGGDGLVLAALSQDGTTVRLYSVNTGSGTSARTTDLGLIDLSAVGTGVTLKSIAIRVIPAARD